MIVILNKVDLVPEEERHTLETLLKPQMALGVNGSMSKVSLP